MREEVRRAALEAAAKLTLSVAALAGGCGTRSELHHASLDAATSDAPADTGAEGTSGDCHAIVEAAFPTPAPYPGVKRDVSVAVLACCEALLITEGSAARNRWDCCANLTDASSVGLACTPWGPPAPPPMLV